jgi:hypothetical protein
MYQLASTIRSAKSSPRRGLTLVELMIAVTLTLVIIGVMVRAFKSTSDEIGIGRARMDMHTKLRAVTETLRRDLQTATCLPRARGLSDERTGYFEYVEGPEYDRNHINPNTNSFLGDHDDVLALTVRSDEKPFRGRYNGGFVESNLAEVVWFLVHTGPDDYSGQYRLYRRVLLIRPDLLPLTMTPAQFFESNDISARPEAADMVPNSLEDLADRSNRYAHDRGTFPHELQNGYGAQATWLSDRVLGFDGDGVFDPDREGEDLMLNGCTAFDIKVFDPTSPVKRASGTDYLLDPNDPGYVASVDPAATTGGYVDLGYDPALVAPAATWFSPNSAPNGYTWTANANTWCSWYAGYEFDGIDQNGNALIDEGSNGVDDDLANGVDDNAERETPPPYANPIRSIQISVRMIEPNSNQVLQKTIKESYVPN